MDKYYVDKSVQLDGNHALHKEGCGMYISQNNKFHIGVLSDCDQAVEKARLLFSNIEGCKDCLPNYGSR